MEHNEIVNSQVAEMLRVAQPIFKKLKIEFYLVGAVARDLHFSLKKDLAPKRKTKDVDLAIWVGDEEEFYKLKDALIATGDFTAHETEAIKLFFRQAIEVDLLPFGDIENIERETTISKPKPFVMDMPGFRELFPHVQAIHLEDIQDLQIVSLEGLVLLKLFAFDDNPSRTKDITDIEYIIEVYFDLNDELIWEQHLSIMDLYDTNERTYLQLVSSRIIGQKLRIFLAGQNALLVRLEIILNKRNTLQWKAMLDGFKD